MWSEESPGDQRRDHGVTEGRIETPQPLDLADVAEERTPLERRLDALGRRLVWMALGVAALVAGLEALHGASLELVMRQASRWRWPPSRKGFRPWVYRFHTDLPES
jgi:hypothetical protein